MERKIDINKWPLIRFIIPASPEVNIFSGQAKKTTALGPVMVATAASKLWRWRVEVIDENNYRNGPKDNQGLPDHEVLQERNPADVVGFYCGLTSTIERVWQLAEFYHEKAQTIAGGWHAHYCPEETLRHNIDVVVHGDGEIVIQKILTAFEQEEEIGDIPSISFLDKGEIKTNPPNIFETPDLNALPYPDFGLLKYAKVSIYPIGRTRGCRMNCEFCSIKGKPRWSTGEHFFKTVEWLVSTRNARSFFIVDDRLEEDIDGTLDFFRRVAERYGNRLNFTVQVRLEAAKNIELLRTMERAGVRVVCIGYESVIDAELRAMNKGYSSAQMLGWTKIWRQLFRIHAMFIFGYPLKDRGTSISPKEMIKAFRIFLSKARPDTVQILHPIPLVGTDLRKRLEEEDRIYPQELAPWSKYDGNFVCFQPDNMTPREFQEASMKLMNRFYSLLLSLINIPLRTIAFPIDCLFRGWEAWHRGWWRNVVRFGGHLLIRRWKRRQDIKLFIERLEKY